MLSLANRLHFVCVASTGPKRTYLEVGGDQPVPTRYTSASQANTIRRPAISRVYRSTSKKRRLAFRARTSIRYSVIDA